MKKLTPTEAMDLMIKGGKVDYSVSDGTKGAFTPLTWNESGEVQDRYGNRMSIQYLILTECVEPKSVDIDVWVNVYMNSEGKVYFGNTSTVKQTGRLSNSDYINTINIKPTVTRD